MEIRLREHLATSPIASKNTYLSDMEEQALQISELLLRNRKETSGGVRSRSRNLLVGRDSIYVLVRTLQQYRGRRTRPTASEEDERSAGVDNARG